MGLSLLFIFFLGLEDIIFLFVCTSEVTLNGHTDKEGHHKQWACGREENK